MTVLVPSMTSAIRLAMYLRYEWVCGLRGRGGKIACLPLEWKAATRIVPEKASFVNAVLTDDLEKAG